MIKHIFELLFILAVGSMLYKHHMYDKRLNKLESIVEYYEMFEEVE